MSSACARLAVDAGIDLSVITRGQTRARPLPAAARVLHGDARDPGQVRELLGHREFDAVVDWVAFTPEHVQLRVGVPDAARPAADRGVHPAAQPVLGLLPGQDRL
jgi:hypothetical protein